MDTNEINSDSQFTQMRQPYNPTQHPPPVVIRKNRNRAPRPHSIGATIISNPKLVKGWQYYDNSPQPKSYHKYFSSVNLPSEEVDSDDTGSGYQNRKGNEGLLTQSNSYLNRDSYRKGVGRYDEPEEDAYVPGIEVPACVASGTDDDEDDDDTVVFDLRESCCKRLVRIVLILLASSTIALSTVLIKLLLEKNYNPVSITVWMLQGVLVPSLIIYFVSFCISLCQPKSIRNRKSHLNKESTPNKYGTIALVIVGAIFGWIGIVLKVYSLEYISVLDSTAISFIAPVFIVICARFYLKEKVGFMCSSAVFLLLIAVGVIIGSPYITKRKQFSRNELTGILLAVGCMLIVIKTVIILRYIRQVHYAIQTFTLGLIGTIGGLLISAIHPRIEFQLPEKAMDYFLGSALAGLCFVGNNLVASMLKREQAGPFALLRAWEIPAVLLWQVLILQERSCLLHSLIGTALVCLAVFLIIVQKLIRQ